MDHNATTRVMVVDDHPMWRDAVARDLTEAGYDVVASAVQNTLGKLRLHNRVEPIRYAIEHGLAGELCSTSILKSAACGR